MKLPGNLTANEFNSRLFKKGAAVLAGQDCDMSGTDEQSDLIQFVRFSFGPLEPSSFESDIAIIKEVLDM